MNETLRKLIELKVQVESEANEIWDMAHKVREKSARIMVILDTAVEEEEKRINEELEQQAQDHAERMSNKEPEVTLGLKD